MWKSDLTDKMKRSFFQAAVVSILLYGCTTWTLTKRLEKIDEPGAHFLSSNNNNNIYPWVAQTMKRSDSVPYHCILYEKHLNWIFFLSLLLPRQKVCLYVCNYISKAPTST